MGAENVYSQFFASGFVDTNLYFPSIAQNWRGRSFQVLHTFTEVHFANYPLILSFSMSSGAIFTFLS